MHGSRGCLGCYKNPPVTILMDEACRGQTLKEDNKSEDLLSSSTIDQLDQSAVQSRKSISSVGTSTQPSDPQTSSGSQIDHPEFVNHGLILWNQIRQQWIGNRKSDSETRVREPIISGNDTYESLLGSNKPFPQPIPLGEMIDFLVDIWEQEGLYD